MSHYSKYDVEVSFLGKSFVVRGVNAFNEDDARRQVKTLLKFGSVTKHLPKPNNDIPSLFKDIFNL